MMQSTGPEIGVYCKNVEELQKRCWLYEPVKLSPAQAQAEKTGLDFGGLVPDLSSRRHPTDDEMEGIVATDATRWQIRLIRLRWDVEPWKDAPTEVSLQNIDNPDDTHVVILGNPANQRSTTPMTDEAGIFSPGQGWVGFHYDRQNDEIRGAPQLTVNGGPGIREQCYINLSRDTLEEASQAFGAEDRPTHPLAWKLYQAIPLSVDVKIVGLEMQPPHAEQAEGIINYTTETPHDGITGDVGSFAVMRVLASNPELDSLV